MPSLKGRPSTRAPLLRVPVRRISILVVLLLVIALSATFSSLARPGSGAVLGIDSFSSSGSSHITMLGADQVIQGGAENYAYVQSVAAQGLKWDRDSVGNSSERISQMNWAKEAGIKVLALIGGADPETACTQGGTGSGVLRSESQYKSYIQGVIDDWPWIHNWEYGNEPQYYWCNISPQHYFQGLVWTYEVLSTTPGHQHDTIQGPTETIYTYAPSGVWDGYDGCGTSTCVDGWDGSTGDKIGWFYSFWHESIEDSYGSWTPAKILTYVSLHVYTQSELFSDVPQKGPYRTVGSMLSTALELYYAVAGGSKDFVISETGMIANSSGGLTRQATWYQQMMPFYQNVSFVSGVFAYSLYDPQWGLFTSDLQPRPAWSVYQGYLQQADSTTTTTTTTTTITSTFSSTSSSLSSSSSTISSESTTSSSSKPPSTNSTTTTSQTPPSPNSSPVSSSTASSSSSSQASSISLKSKAPSPETSTSSSNIVDDANSSVPGSTFGFLSSLSPSKNPPAAAGFAAYEIFLVGGFSFLSLNFLRRHRWTLRR